MGDMILILSHVFNLQVHMISSSRDDIELDGRQEVAINTRLGI